jgi:hypothetical protein
MSTLLTSVELDAARARLTPYMRGMTERAADHALLLAAEFVTLEHVLGVVLLDEDSAAHQTVVHAFADPETVAEELLALSPGLMVVGSTAALPFSTCAIDALEDARRRAESDGAESVAPALLLEAAVHALPREVREALAAAGFGATIPEPDPAPEPARGTTELPPATLFRSFSDGAKQALGRACRGAHAAGEPSIGPARLVLALLGLDPSLATSSGLSAASAGSILRGRTLDPTPPRPRQLEADPGLLAFLGALPEGAGSLALMRACLTRASEELRELLLRHKLGSELLERASQTLFDPD